MTMHRSIAAALMIAAGSVAPLRAQESSPAPTLPTALPEKSMVRVNITSQPYNQMLPWQKVSPGTRRGLGALLSGNRVLVTAELAQDASYAELEIAASGRKLTAKIEAIDYEVNLATVVPEGDAGDFFNGMVPLEVDTALKPKAKIDVWQFENNGSPVTSSMELNRADMGNYFLDEQPFLLFQANGAVQYRGGTFTLPVIHEGKLGGMLLRYNTRDQVADILPAVMIDRFLKDAAEAPYDGFPSFGAKLSATLDPQLRSFLRLDGIEGGVLITSVVPNFSADRAGLKEGDVLLEINGLKLDSRGYYTDPDYGILGASHILRGRTKAGETAKLRVFRDSKQMDLDCPMLRRNPTDYLIDPYMFDRGPRYLILGGIILQELNLPYLQRGSRNGSDWRDNAPFRLMYAQANQEDILETGRRKLVFLSAVLPAPCNQGYERLRQLIVTKVNGKVINDIKDLAEAVKSPIDGIHHVEFDDFPRIIHIDAAAADEDAKEFLPKRYRINKLARLE